MRWPPWSTDSAKNDDDKRRQVSWAENLNATNWAHFTEPQVVIPSLLMTTGILFTRHVFRSYVRRIPEAVNIRPTFFRKRSLFGTVTRVGDGDNFHLFHTPLGRLAGWYWWRKVPDTGKELKSNTIHVRLAGVDAPECAHFGRPAQPYSTEALEWLKSYVLDRRVRAYIYKKDHYDRVVATVYVRRGLIRRDVGLQMIKAGMATVYEAKTGAEYGTLEAKYRKAEGKAKAAKKGLWSTKEKLFESPRDYKRRMMALDANGATTK